MLITKAWAIPEQILGSNNRWEYQTHLSRPLTPHQRTVHSPTGWPREKQGQTLDQKWWTTSPLPLRLLHAPLCKEDQPTENRPHSYCIQHKCTSPFMHSTRTFWEQALFQALCKVLDIQRWWDAVPALRMCFWCRRRGRQKHKHSKLPEMTWEEATRGRVGPLWEEVNSPWGPNSVQSKADTSAKS